MSPTIGQLDELLERAKTMGGSGGRRLLGITGPPGAGKSTLARLVADRLGPDLVRVVGMDGFHLSNAELARLDRAQRKGAPDTFDVDGYVVLLHRLRHNREPVIYAPLFDRSQEEPIAAGVSVPASVPLVVTEGNYLLTREKGWERVRPLLDWCWYVEMDDTQRIARLEARHHRHGKSLAEARRWARESDQRNAELVARTRDRADVVVRLPAGECPQSP
ncbi:MAG: nucleoside/nucleotide kinase family protein [Propionibacteriales bacterium]|nr:nucleoside/nucleotide kinase family protein [Propionibacteriales bacterium]